MALAFTAGLTKMWPKLGDFMRRGELRRTTREPNMLPNRFGKHSTVDLGEYILEFRRNYVGLSYHNGARLNTLRYPKSATAVYLLNATIMITNADGAVIMTRKIQSEKLVETPKPFHNALAVYKLPSGMFVVHSEKYHKDNILEITSQEHAFATTIDDFGAVDGMPASFPMRSGIYEELVKHIPAFAGIDPRSQTFPVGPRLHHFRFAYHGQYYSLYDVNCSNADVHTVSLHTRDNTQLDICKVSSTSIMYDFGNRTIITHPLGEIIDARYAINDKLLKFQPPFRRVNRAFTLPCGIYVVDADRIYLYNAETNRALPIKHDIAPHATHMNDYGETM